MAVSVPVNVTKEALIKLIVDGNALSGTSGISLSDYLVWKTKVRSTIGIIYGTANPELREIDNGFWAGENTPPEPQPNLPVAMGMVVGILQNFLDLFGFSVIP